MADNIDIKDAGNVTVPVSTVDKTAAGNGELQLVGLDYGTGTARQVLTEKPATEAAQTTANNALGAPADAEATSDGTIIGVLKRLRTLLGTIASAVTGTLTVGGTVAVSNFPATQPVSGTVTATGPLTDAQLRATAVPVSVSGVATAANQTTTNTALGAPADTEATGDGSIIAVLKRIRTLLSGSLSVTGTFWQATQPVSAASLPLPSGAATEATLGNVLTTSAFQARVPANGQAAMAASVPVVIASNQSAVPTVENATVFTGASAQTAVVNNILESVSGATGTACENIRAASVQVVSTGTGGTFIFEQSNDNTNWIALPVFNAALVTGVPITAAITATASAIIYTFPVRSRFVRLRIATTITGGSIQAFSRFSTEPWTAAAQLVASNTAANLAATVSGTVTANIGTGALAAGTNAIGDVGQQYRANATGAASGAHIVSAASVNATVVKASAGRVLGWALGNNSAGWRYVKLHNQTTTPTAGTGVVRTIAIAPGGMAQMKLEGGIGFATGIALTIVTGAADADATAVGANEVVGELLFA